MLPQHRRYRTLESLNQTNTKRAGTGAMAIITAIQDRVPARVNNPGELIAAAAIVLQALCKQGGVDPVYAMQVGYNLTYDGQKRRPEMRGMVDYIEKEIYGYGEE